MAESRILIRQEGKRGFIKIEGEGTFQNASAFKTASREMLQSGVTDFVLDLGSCESLDSTMLGHFLGLGLKLKEKTAGHIRVLKANGFIRNSFRGFGMDRMFFFDEPEAGGRDQIGGQ